MSLPNEIILATLELLDKSDLKKVRQVSKSWCACASVYLFDKLYISASKVDLDVSDAVVEHPDLSHCVRRLIYNGAEFTSRINKRQYVHELFRQRPINIKAGTGLYVIACDDPDPDIQEWIRRSWERNEDEALESAFEDFRNRTFVDAGWQKYKEHALYQQKLLEGGMLIRILVHGLHRLNSLQSVSLKGTWGRLRTPNHRRHGSPLARSWNNFHCAPSPWSWEYPKSQNSAFGSECYEVLTSALAKTERQITSFKVAHQSPGIPALMFVRGPPASMKSARSDVIAFTRLRSLSLKVAAQAFPIGYMPSDHDLKANSAGWGNLSGLSDLLDATEELEHLSLDMPMHPGISRELRYRYSQVFSRESRWNRLKSHRLEHLAMTAEKIMHLVIRQVPNLKRLMFNRIYLREGKWECVIQALQELESPPALKFPAASDPFLGHTSMWNSFQHK